MEPLDAVAYRLQYIPEYLDRFEVARLISKFLADGEERDVSVASLATSCELKSSSVRSKTAILQFRKLPAAVLAAPLAGQWTLEVPGLSKPLILDDQFDGLTPLNEIPPDQHENDCIIVTGLGSHPMGSWQNYRNGRSFMWVRDALPALAPGVRFIIYGHGNDSIKSDSGQTVSDIASDFISSMRIGGFLSPTAKPLAFFAHSLGGIVLKQAMVMLADSGVVEASILDRTKGAIMFSVPSRGIRISDILSMIGSQPSESLAMQISDNSPYLSELENQICGISYLRDMKIFWAYETKPTANLEFVEGDLRRSGPATVLVTPSSATGNRCTSEPGFSLRINANHFNMVKFSSRDPGVAQIANKLLDVLKKDTSLSLPLKDSTADALKLAPDPLLDPHFWSLQFIIKSLRVPKKDSRLEQIDPRAAHTFEWAFGSSSVGLTEWLQDGDGLFWIHGHPASGKSTLMKFLQEDPRTQKLLRGWQTSPHQVHASFYFHHRGSAIQKSFEGLLRCVLSQILEQDPEIFFAIEPMFRAQYKQHLATKDFGTLHSDLVQLFEACGLEPDSEMNELIAAILNCELPLKLFFEQVVVPMTDEKVTVKRSWEQIGREIIRRREEIIAASKNNKLKTLDLEVFREGWDPATKELFVTLLRKWLEAVDLEEMLLKLKDLPNIRPLISGKLGRKFESDFNHNIQWALERHRTRENYRMELEDQTWTLPRLKQAFDHIVRQQSFDLDMCLFIDALDEHDGGPELISEFLKGIAQNQNMRTRVKILFSSRPWDAFTEAFSGCPGFPIHEHTQNDIRELCSQTVKPDAPGSKEILRLVDEIVQRASGVFLWAKLMLQDMMEIAAISAEAGNDAESLHSDLMIAVRMLPQDLLTYYKAIIERVSYSFRWEAFCLLEVLSKSYEAIFFEQVPEILSCSTLINFDQHSAHNQQTPASKEEAEEMLRPVSGGLIEVVEVFQAEAWPSASRLSSGRKYQLQLIHHTLVDFVEQSGFKQSILGQRLHITEENGHTFLTKYFLFNKRFNLSAAMLRHAKMSEMTTGKSLYPLLFHGGISTFDLVLADKPQFAHVTFPLTVSPIGLAVAGHFRLSLKEALEEDKDIFSHCDESLLSLILCSLDCGVYSIDDAVAMVHFIRDQGYDINNDTEGLGRILISCQFTRYGDGRLQSISDMETLAQAVLDECKDFQVDVPTLPDLAVSAYSKMLHLCTPRLAGGLLKRGADPNEQNPHGLTPLDSVVRSHDVNRRVTELTKRDLYEHCLLLCLAGGMLRVCSRFEWDNMVQSLEKSGFDVSVFLEQQFPKWVTQTQDQARSVTSPRAALSRTSSRASNYTMPSPSTFSNIPSSNRISNSTPPTRPSTSTPASRLSNYEVLHKGPIKPLSTRRTNSEHILSLRENSNGTPTSSRRIPRPAWRV